MLPDRDHKYEHDTIDIKVGDETITWHCSENDKLVIGQKLKEGVKFDKDKNRLELIPPEAIWGLGEILTFGAKKYDDRNWEKGMKWSRIFGAAMRHMWQWWWTKKPDPETGYSHLKHALCCVAFLVAYEERKVGEDDRP